MEVTANLDTFLALNPGLDTGKAPGVHQDPKDNILSSER